MDLTLWAAIGIIALAVVGILRGIDVRLVLAVAALALGLLAGDLAPIAREFLATFSNEKFVVPICSAMGFAYVLKHTGCDSHLVRVLVAPLKYVRFLIVPGVVLVGFAVNIPVISQTSTAVCLGAVVVPLMRAAGFSSAAIGATLLLGASVGGELLNPGAPELLTVQAKTGVDTRAMMPDILRLVLPILGVSLVVFWAMTWWSERKPTNPTTPTSVEPATPTLPHERINPLKALVPLVPLALLFATGPPLNLVSIPQRWVVNRPHPDPVSAIASPAAAAGLEAKRDPAYGSRLIGFAMIVGVGVAVVVVPAKAGGCMKALFDGAGYGFTHIISLIVIANCFGKGIEQVGLARHLGDLIVAQPGLLHPLAGIVPWAFATICGSGMASTQSLYGFFHGPAVGAGADPIAVGAMVSVGSAVGRTMSPVAAVVLMCGTLTGAKPFALVKRVGPPLLAGLAVAIVLRILAWV